MPYCPECSAAVPAGVVVCPTCGASLVPTPAEEPGPDAPIASDIELVTRDLSHSLAPQYEFLRVLGAGGMGAVLLMREPALKRLVAVKVLAPWLAADARARTRFEREARAAAALSHPNVVRVFAEGETSGLKLPYIVMQYVDGPTLTEWMAQRRRASEREARRILGEVAAALAAAHARQLVHRDVKPSNVLIENESGRAYVVDFGVSAALASTGEDEATRLTETGTVAGTPIYMSPEQAAGEQVSPKSDVYSLGILAYELIVGELPYTARTAMGWAAAHLRDTPTSVRVRRADLAPEVAALVDRCLAKEPDGRPTADEVARGLLPSIESEIEWPPPGLHWYRGRGTALGRLGAAATAGALLTLTSLLLTPTVLRVHGNWLWRFQLARAGPGTDPSSVPLFLWQTSLALGLAVFALGTIAFLALAMRLVARGAQLRREGWRWATLADLAADRDGRTGSILSGAREFASLEAPRREGILRARRRTMAWRAAAGLWISAGLALWAVVLAVAAPSATRGAPIVGLALWLVVALPPLAALAAGSAARWRERQLVRPLRRTRRAATAETDAARWYSGVAGGGEPAPAPRPILAPLARTLEVAAIAAGIAAVLAVAEAAVAGVAAVIFTERLGPTTVAFLAEQARLANDDPMGAARRAVRDYLPASSAAPADTALEWLRGIRWSPEQGGLPGYVVPPTSVLAAPEAALRDAGRGGYPRDSLAAYEILGNHPRTAAFRRLARFDALDSLAESRGSLGGSVEQEAADFSPVRTPITEAAVANVAGAVVDVARRRFDSAAVRLGEVAAFAQALLRAADPRLNQLGAQLLTNGALGPLAALATSRGDAARAAELAYAAQRMAGAMPAAGGAAGLAVDPKDFIQFTGAVLSPRAPAGYRVEWMAQGWAGLCANPWELLTGPSAARREAILATVELAADVPQAREIAAQAGEQWGFRYRRGWGGLAGFVADRGPWGLAWRIRECARST